MNWQPAHESHAIERVAVTFTLAGPVSTKPWQEGISDASKRITEEGFVAIGPPPMSQAGLSLLISARGMELNPPGGLQFIRVEAEQMLEELALQRNALSYATTRYHRWASFHDRALDLIGSVLDFSLRLESLSSIKLEYWDRFVSDRPLSEVSYGELLRKDSERVPNFVFGISDLFHAHSGNFVFSDKFARRLVNVNLDALDVANSPGPGGDATIPGLFRRSIGIYTMFQDDLRPDQSPTSASETASRLEDMHLGLKELLAGIISDAAIERISLMGGDG